MSNNSSIQNWTLPEQYNLSKEELQIVQQRAARRQILKHEYQRILYNPFKNMSVEGGTPFDPAIQRFGSTRADYYQYFKPNKKNFAAMMLIYFIPFSMLYFFAERQHMRFDARCRSGEIPWRYRSKKVL